MDQDSSNDKADMGVATTHARKTPDFPLRKMATHGVYNLNNIKAIVIYTLMILPI